MGDQGYDDGLVHGHSWASEPLARPLLRNDIPLRRSEIVVSSDDGFDDGLVHNHSWARSV